MDIEQQFKEYLTGKLKELQKEGRQDVNSIAVEADDFAPGMIRFYFRAYTKGGGNTQEHETAQAALNEALATVKPLEPKAYASHLRERAAGLLVQAEQLEALS